MDWQISRYGSPVIDLIYYIFSATDKDLRASEYKNLLNLYHSSLSEIVKKLGSDPEKLFSFKDFEAQIKKFGKFPFLMTPILIQVMLAAAKDINDMEEVRKDMVTADKKITLVSGFDDRTQLAFNKRINDVITDMVDFGLYWK